MKKIIVFTVVMFFSLGLSTSAFASENESDKILEDLSQKGEIIYMDEEITVRSFGDDPEIAEAILNHPNSVVEKDNSNITTFGATGSGGWSNITASDSGRSVYWSVKPATAWPFHFSGTVKLRYYSGFKRDVPVGGMGALNSTVSGSVSMNKNNGGIAYFSGTAYAISGDRYKVLPGVNVSFRPN